MHEFSLADALLEQVTRHTPTGAKVTVVRVRVGPILGLDSDNMQTAWSAVANEPFVLGSRLELIAQPWRLSCGRCGRRWESVADGPLPPLCEDCGLPARADDAGELRLDSLEIADPSPL